MTNRHAFIPPLLSTVIGIDRLFSLAESKLNQASGSTFPPYNVIKVAEDDYRIELAVAGFALEDIKIESKEQVIVITGERKSQEAEGSTYLHQGIASRCFRREFQLSNFVKVKGASLNNGILAIELTREVPESQKYRKIDINIGTTGADSGSVGEQA